MRRIVPILLACLNALPAEARDYRWFDAHLHFVDFFQETVGMPALLRAMDEADVSHALVSGVPLLKVWHADAPQRPRYFQGDEAPLYYYSATDALVAEAVRQLPAGQRRRLAPFIAGFNPTDMNAADHVRRMLELYPGLWRGIGEILARHDDLTALTQGEVARADHPALMRVYELAAEHGLPVLLHSNITSKREKRALYVPELEAALAAHPRTRFIWAHAGSSESLHRYQGRLPFLRGEVERLLAEHDNLWIDLSWAVLEVYLLPGGSPDPDWLALVRRYPNRFLVGTDALGSFGRLGETIGAFAPFLDALPEDVANRLAHRNAEALLLPAPPAER